jgi:hypothetical protein
MNHIFEYASFYKPGDLVLVEYWYNGMVTPVKILEGNKGRYLVSHDTDGSRIKNAPDEWVRSSDIIDRYAQTIPSM